MTNLIKLSAIGSTNSYLKELSKKQELEDGLIVFAENQTEGRGQPGNTWQSEAGKSLTFSLFKRFTELKSDDQIFITCGAALAIKNALNKLWVPNLSIKWPNDIMSDNRKIAGILTESQVSGGYIRQAIIGIGINVNEVELENLPQATSMLLKSKIQFDLEEVLQIVTDQLQANLSNLEQLSRDQLILDYETNLFRKDKVSVFEDNSTHRFNGIIRGITPKGKLLVENEDEKMLKFGPKEIRLCY